jgi:LuxR family quorum sensing-dependent transcriptional regulator
MHFPNLEQFIERITSCKTTGDLYNLCGASAAQIGFDYFCLAHRDFTSLAKPEDTIISNFPEDWKSYYFEQQYDRIDPVLFTVLANPTPVVWHDAFQRHPEHIYILNERKEAGAGVGVSSAIYMPGMFTFLSFASSRMSSTDLQRGAIFTNICIGYFHERLLDICTKRTTLPSNLTPRQLEIIFWLAEGKDVSSIASILKCAERTVSAHIQEIKKQTNSLNITHAVAKVLLNQQEFNRIIKVTGNSP